jgi:hypothetical protein
MKEEASEGKIGDLEYRVGTRKFSSYWQTDYAEGGKGKGKGPFKHAVRDGLAKFVALRFAEPEKK